MTHVTMEVLPKPKILSEGSVTTTRNITENTVEFQGCFIRVNVEIGKESSVIIGNE